MLSRVRRQSSDQSETQAPAQIPIPWFVLGFLAMVLIASTGAVSPTWRSASASLAQVLLAFALSAVGLETDLRRLMAQGWQPMALGALATLFMGTSTLGMIVWLAP